MALADMATYAENGERALTIQEAHRAVERLFKQGNPSAEKIIGENGWSVTECPPTYASTGNDLSEVCDDLSLAVSIARGMITLADTQVYDEGAPLPRSAKDCVSKKKVTQAMAITLARIDPDYVAASVNEAIVTGLLTNALSSPADSLAVAKLIWYVVLRKFSEVMHTGTSTNIRFLNANDRVLQTIPVSLLTRVSFTDGLGNPRGTFVLSERSCAPCATADVTLPARIYARLTKLMSWIALRF
jgi:hypothetical protein